MIAYYINLDRATERRSHMEQQAIDLGIELVRIAGVDGRQMSDQQALIFRPHAGSSHYLSKIEVACFLSHRLAWEKIAYGTNSYGAVFEDDLLFSSRTPLFLNQFDWIPNACKIIKIETTARRLSLVPPSFRLHDDRSLWRMASSNMGGGGYIISQEVARWLLAQTLTFVEPLDVFLFHVQSPVWQLTSIYHMVPALCVQQVRSKKIFMDTFAGKSQMDGHRGTNNLKRSRTSKMALELIRPFQQFFRYLVNTSKSKLKGGQYKKINMR